MSADDEFLRQQIMPSLRPPPISKPTEPVPSDALAIIPAAPQTGQQLVKTSGMGPPPLPARGAGKPRAPKKVALDEDEYLERMGKIIERDFFPDIPKLELQLKVREEHLLSSCFSCVGRIDMLSCAVLQWMDAVESKDKRRIAAVRREIKEKTAQTPLPHRPEAIATPIATPLHAAAPAEAEADSVLGSVTAGSAVSAPPASEQKLSLDEFHAKFTSEDNQSFDELMERTLDKKQKAYWWAYDDNAAERTAALGIANRPHHAEFSDEGKHLEDRAQRPPQLDTWKHRTRNALLFLPDMEASRDTSRVVDRGNGGSTAIVLSGSSTPGAGQLTLFTPTQEGGMLPPKVIQHANTRFVKDGKIAGGLEAVLVRDDGTQVVAHADGTAGAETEAVSYGLVRSPSPTPGDADDEPVMTWGNIESTPLILDARLAGDTSTPSNFRVSSLPTREALAHALDLKAQARKADAAKKRKRSASNSTMSAGSRGSGTLTPLMAMSHLTPQAQSLAQKMFAGRSSKLGGDTALRASYGATPLNASGAGVRTGAGLTARTPVGTPLVTSSGAGGGKLKGSSKLTAPPMAAGGKSLTDNLLRI